MPEITVPVVPNLTDSQKIFSSIIDNQIALNTTVERIQEDLSRHQKILVDGNGELPLVEIVRNHTAFIEGMRYWMRFLGGALIVQTLAFATSVVIAVVKFLPVLERIASQP